MSHEEIDPILARQSLEHLRAIQESVPGAAAELTKWLKQSRRHTEHYLMTVAFEKELDEVTLDPSLQIDRTAHPDNVLALSSAPVRAPSTVRQRHVGKWAGALAAGVACAIVAAYWQPDRHEIATAVGEQRTVALEDGSVVYLNTQSRVALEFTSDKRDIELLGGEALFKVHQDTRRPFRVYTGEAMIQAIGTTFNVHRTGFGTTVAVLEGRVKVDHLLEDTGKPADTSKSASLGIGDQARIEPSGKITSQRSSNADNITAWRQRRLIFAGAPLQDIAAEFNRYNRNPKFVLEDVDRTDWTYSGIFDADDPQSLVQLLERESGLVVEKSEGRIVVRGR